MEAPTGSEWSSWQTKGSREISLASRPPVHFHTKKIFLDNLSSLTQRSHYHIHNRLIFAYIQRFYILALQEYIEYIIIEIFKIHLHQTCSLFIYLFIYLYSNNHAGLFTKILIDSAFKTLS